LSHSQRGFTLIEVIVSMVILSFLSLFTVQSIQKALQTKSKVQKDIDKNSTLRDALRIMERDINMAFNYRDVNIELYNEAQKYRQQQAQKQSGVPQGTQTGTPSPNQALTPAQQAANNDPTRFQLKTEKIFTQFLGEPQALSFTSLSNVRMMEDTPMSSQAEIGYSLKPCRRRSNQEQSSQCLWRRVDNYFHDDITRDGQETVLLENVKEFKLRYLGPGRDDEWVDTWMTNERGDDQTKGRFPYAVEITIEIKNDSSKAKDKSLRMTTVAEISNPNNPPDPEDPNNPNGQQPNGINNGQNNNVTQGVPASQAPDSNGNTVGH
jgi:prepilin-type N-terminal cleavage/methylation domain-containing protein